MKSAYIVGRLQKEMELYLTGIPGPKSITQLNTLADGCIGVMLVFSNKKKAKQFAGKYPILTARVGKGSIDATPTPE